MGEFAFSLVEGGNFLQTHLDIIIINVNKASRTSLPLFTFVHWRRKWQPTPVFLPGESPGMGEPGGLPSMGSHRVGHN